MTSVESALKPFVTRLKRLRALKWAVIGLGAGMGAALLIRAASYLWAFPTALYWCALAVVTVPLLFAAAARLCPFSMARAARCVDERGLEARAQTALMLKESNTPMALMQREDTLKTLGGADPRALFPVKTPRAPVIAALACVLVFGLSFLIENPNNALLRAKADYRAAMTKQAELVDEGAAALEAGDPQTPELRKLLGDLSRELRKAEDAREGLLAADEAERAIQKIQAEAQKDARKALEQGGLQELQKALDEDDLKTAQELLEKLKQADNGEQLKTAAASAATAATQAALQAALQALSAGNASQAARLLQSALGGQSTATAQALGISGAARCAAAQAGAQTSAVSGTASMTGMGAGTGAGAGLGSSDADAGFTGRPQAAVSQGSADPHRRVADYEPIYDPTRLNVEGAQINERGRQGEGEISEADAGLGIGVADGAVPYNEVLREYSDKAAEAAGGGELPPYAQKWVEEYFRLISE